MGRHSVLEKGKEERWMRFVMMIKA